MKTKPLPTYEAHLERNHAYYSKRGNFPSYAEYVKLEVEYEEFE